MIKKRLLFLSKKDSCFDKKKTLKKKTLPAGRVFWKIRAPSRGPGNPVRRGHPTAEERGAAAKASTNTITNRYGHARSTVSGSASSDGSWSVAGTHGGGRGPSLRWRPPASSSPGGSFSPPSSTAFGAASWEDHHQGPGLRSVERVATAAFHLEARCWWGLGGPSTGGQMDQLCQFGRVSR